MIDMIYTYPCCFNNSRNFHCIEEAVAARDEFVRKVVGSFTKSKDSSIPRKYKNWVDNSNADKVLPVMSNGRMQPSFVIARLSFCCRERECCIDGCYSCVIKYVNTRVDLLVIEGGGRGERQGMEGGTR